MSRRRRGKACTRLQEADELHQLTEIELLKFAYGV